MKQGDTITLAGKSRLGKSIIGQHGSKWQVLHRTETMVRIKSVKTGALAHKWVSADIDFELQS